METVMLYPAACKLPFRFDTKRLAADLELVDQDLWIDHYRGENYTGSWSVAALKSVGGHPTVIYASPAPTSSNFYQNAPILEKCTYFAEVINTFQCQVNAVRLMKLEPGSSIKEHQDFMGEGAQLELRIHIPILTNPGISFFIDGHRIPMNPGEVWFGDFNRPHRVENNSTERRVHLVLDCTQNDWLSDQIQVKGIKTA